MLVRVNDNVWVNPDKVISLEKRKNSVIISFGLNYQAHFTPDEHSTVDACFELLKKQLGAKK